jgi:Protein of unknown function (DUF3489)
MEIAMTKTKNNATSKTKTPAAKSAKTAGRSKPDSANLAEQLSDMQLVALSAASQRDDRTIAIPDALEDEAIATFAATLINLGLAEEAPAERGQPVWRQDQVSGQPITLRITEQALTVLGIDEGDEAKGAEDTGHNESVGMSPVADGAPATEPRADIQATASVKAPKAATAAPTAIAATDNAPSQSRRAEPPQPRAGSKQGQLITMLSRDEGVSIIEIATALGWLPHTTRAALTGLRHKGYELAREITGERGSIYRIIAMPIAAMATDNAAMAEAA